MNRAANAGSACNTRSISFLAIFRTDDSVRAEHGNNGLFPTFRDHRQLHPALLDKEHSFCRVPLAEYDLPFPAGEYCSALPAFRQEKAGIEPLSYHRLPAALCQKCTIPKVIVRSNR